MRLILASVAAALLLLACLTGPDGAAGWGAPPPARPFPVWIAGNDCDHDPALQVHPYGDDVWIIRQSKCVHYEAPFLYLVVGEERALLVDTGAPGNPPLRETVDELLAGRDVELIVAHSHAHFDHVANDRQFEGRENTVIVPWEPEDVAEFYGIREWPTELGSIDLGGRVLDVIPTPGHHPAHIAFYDERTGLLLSGDTLYPGFLFVFRPDDWDVFVASTRRLVEFAAEHPIRAILGGHVEMQDAPGKTYRYGSRSHPNERPLELGVEHLLELERRCYRPRPAHCRRTGAAEPGGHWPPDPVGSGGYCASGNGTDGVLSRPQPAGHEHLPGIAVAGRGLISRQSPRRHPAAQSGSVDCLPPRRCG